MSCGWSACLPQHILIRWVVLAALVSMAKTHLEHQVIKFKQNKYGNATAYTVDPYANYNPKEGITTALILGITFILTIIYISFKYGCNSFKARFCPPKDHRIPTKSDIEARRPKTGAACPHIREHSVPIVVQDGTVAIDPKSDDVLNENGQTTSHVKPTVGSSHSAQVDNFTLVISEGSPKKVTRTVKSRSSSESRDRSSVKDETRQLLPPAVNQVLRTAHWVNTVINSEKSTPADDSDAPQQTSKGTTQVEINHKQDTDELVTKNSYRNHHQEEKTLEFATSVV